MRRLIWFIAAATVLLGHLCAAATLVINPTTTLSAQTSNNTSTANSFTTQTNGNLGAANISKMDIHSLLYAGANTKVLAHLLLWFGKSNHMDVGYSSTDAAQVKRQIDDMVSRGIEGVIVDWYGSGTVEDDATLLVMAEAEKHPGFTFAIMIDKGAIQYDSCSGCTPQQALIAHLQYIQQTYFSSPAYLKLSGAPVVTNFDIDLYYSVDWAAAAAALSPSPVFLFQNTSGFAHVASEGSYSWVIPSMTDYGISYLTDFYTTGMQNPTKQTVGATYKGFNDTLASWGSNRIMGQQCGQTWLQMFSEINGLYNASQQLPWLQLVTWNDYEEGSEIESGIDNCAGVSASMKGSSLQWTLSGSQSAIDHYTAYISTDGQNLMPLTNLASSLRSLDLCSYSLSPGNYTLYLQAIGKATLKNQISKAVSYTPTCTSLTGISLAATPTALTLQGGQSGAITVTVNPQNGSFNNSVSLFCSNVPVGITCAFTPSSVTPGSGGANSTLSITTTSLSSSLERHPHGRGLIYLGSFFPFAVAGLALTFQPKGKRRLYIVLGILLLAIMVGLGGCGGGQASPTSHSSLQTYTITINGSSGSTQSSVNAMVTIR